MFVSFEGIDAAGKDTAAGMMYRRLASELDGSVVFLTKGQRNGLSPQLREYFTVLDQAIFPKDPAGLVESFPPLYWTLLTSAWYLGFYRQMIEPHLRQGKVVLINNWYFKIAARYEFKGTPRSSILGCFTSVPRPDLSIFLDTPAEVAVERREYFTPVECGALDGFPADKSGFVAYQSHIRKILQEYAGAHGWRVIRKVVDDDVIAELAGSVLGARDRAPA